MLKAVVLLCVVALATCALIGGYNHREVDDEDVVAAANHAAKSLSKTFAGKYHHRLAKVAKAESQVVNGVNYRLTVIVGKTTCKKDEVEFENASNCEFQEGISTYKKCTTVVYKSLQGEHKLVTSGCILATKKDL
ncbi:hypothetical protein JTE90_007462 [Oedothorax gibbosus]|uniref:Cystatin domain-containing protein n=1 Tax=Oedothorax gibbosus TaxID=931172 RepID=A0AAV6U7F8_9ARAC|nr:hypothetical protein JTE90_007462 [Oedothorax gibbosus]